MTHFLSRCMFALLAVSLAMPASAQSNTTAGALQARTIPQSDLLAGTGGGVAGVTVGPGLSISGGVLSAPVPGAVTAQTAGYLMKAPRRTIMTSGFAGSGSPTFTQGGYSALTTFVVAKVIEGPAYAVRFGFANPYALPMQIVSARVAASDSFAGTTQPTWEPSTANLTVIPTKNSVFQTGTTVSGNAVISGLTTAALPSGTTMYVIGAGIAADATATVTDSTHVTMSANATASGTVTLQFANLAPSCQLFFDNKGADIDTINASGTATGITVNNPFSPNNNAQNFTMQYSDFAPCTVNTPRADSGQGFVVMVYVTLGPSSGAFGRPLGSPASYNTLIAPLFGNRYMKAGIAWNGNVDYSGNPTGSGFKGFGNTPVMSVQYMTDAPGINVVHVGDSISTSPSTDGISTPFFQACLAISTPQFPCETSSVAWGGTGTSIYMQDLIDNARSMWASLIVGQPFTRNEPGGANLANYQLVTAKLLSTLKSLDRSMQTQLILYGEWPFTTTVDGNAQAIADLVTERNRLATIQFGCTPSSGGSLCPAVQVLDPVPYVSRAALGGEHYRYLGIKQVANGNTSAGATSIPITAGVVSCYAGDVLTDATNPSGVLNGATVISATNAALTVANTAVIGGGITSGDALVCSYPGWAGGALSDDNTHPNIAGMALLRAQALTQFKQAIGVP